MPLPLLLLGQILRHRATFSDWRAPAEQLGLALNSLTDMLAQERDPMARAVWLALLDMAPAERAALAALARASGPMPSWPRLPPALACLQQRRWQRWSGW